MPTPAQTAETAALCRPFITRCHPLGDIWVCERVDVRLVLIEALLSILHPPWRDADPGTEHISRLWLQSKSHLSERSVRRDAWRRRNSLVCWELLNQLEGQRVVSVQNYSRLFHIITLYNDPVYPFICLSIQPSSILTSSTLLSWEALEQLPAGWVPDQVASSQDLRQIAIPSLSHTRTQH